MNATNDLLGGRETALRAVYGSEIEALKRQGRRRKARRHALGAVLAMALLAGAGFAGLGMHEVAAGPTSPRHIALADGSTIHLDAGAAIELPFNPWRRRARLNRGKAVFDIVHDESAPFVVEAGNARLTDLGTRFLVHMEPARVDVAVFEGRVELEEARPGRIRRLDAGMAASASAAGIFAAPLPDEVLATAWRDGRLVFRETLLAEVAERLSRYSTTPIRVTGKAIAQIKVSGTFRIDDIDGALRTLEQALPIRVQHVGGTLTIQART